jgi:hypothetical protein
MSKINQSELKTSYNSQILVGNYLLTVGSNQYYEVSRKVPGKPSDEKVANLSQQIYIAYMQVNRLSYHPYQHQIASIDSIVVKIIDIDKQSIEMTFDCAANRLLCFYGECIRTIFHLNNSEDILTINYLTNLVTLFKNGQQQFSLPENSNRDGLVCSNYVILLVSFLLILV